MNKNAARVKYARLTVAEIQTEKRYRKEERLGHLCGTNTPTPTQLAQAELEADLWESRLLINRIINGKLPEE